MAANRHFKTVIEYAESIRDGKKIACKELKQAVDRFFRDLENPEYELNHAAPDFCINIIENTFCHQQGERLDGEPLRGKPFLLEPFHKFIIYNLLGFRLAGTKIVRFHEALIYIPRKNIKALALDTPIPTPCGWRNMDEIHVGDYVFGRDGKPAKVLFESEIFNKPMYAITFDDGEIIKASEDHIWTVITKDSRRTAKYNPKGRKPLKAELRKTGGWFETTTKELAENFKTIRSDGKGIEYRYRIPMNGPIEYPQKNLPIDPYTFGVWLGDGTSKGCAITCSDSDRNEMMRLVSAEGHVCRWHDSKDRAGYFSIDAKEGRGGHHKNQFIESLRKLGVYKNKHIPGIYMYSSIAQRMALLQGLMDTDGTATKAGQCVFSQKSKFIAEQVLHLVRSLGFKGTIRQYNPTANGKQCVAYQVQFWTDKTKPCFRMKRKAQRLKEKLSNRMFAKSIVDIKSILAEPSKCIAVDNEDHLYLCGKNYTVTHNTGFAAALSYALGLWYRRSGAKVYIASAALMQSLESYNFIKYNIQRMGEWDKDGGHVHIIDNNNEHSLTGEFSDGSFFIRALASNPDAQDSLNCNIAICDEIHAFTKPKQYTLFKDAMKAYTNKLLIGISTAGDNEQAFLGQRLKYCRKILDGSVTDESYFVFMCCANPGEDGEIDFTNPVVHEMANPAYGVSIRPDEILNDSLQALNDPQARKEFFAKSLNVYTNSLKAWFDVGEFQRSDGQYTWTLEELARLPISWYGGADLSRMYDLTATALFGQYQGVDIIITHAFCPVTMAHKKADEDNIPLFLWSDMGWLTMCNSPTVNMGDVVNWFVQMRDKGFKIRQVGHDRKFAGEEYFPLMKAARFSIVDQPQLYFLKSRGFRHIEKAAKDGKLYYLHSPAYEYCVSNVRAVEKVDDAVQYEKVDDHSRIDLFDASVFACIRCLEAGDKARKNAKWFGVEKE